MNAALLLSVLGGIGILLILILYFKIPAFVSLLVSSILVGLFAGMPPEAILATIQTGMASTLGFVAIVVGLGTLFGALLENSGGATALAVFLVKKFGDKKAHSAMAVAGFLIAIPVFFDVAFIILMPMIYALQQKTGKSLLHYALPLLAGLAITHAFIPPTPGPIAVADILGAELGWVILFGFLVGIPCVVLAGILFGQFIGEKIHISAPSSFTEEKETVSAPSVSLILVIIGTPILLIVAGTMAQQIHYLSQDITTLLVLLGHPFIALIIANLIAWYVLGIRKGFSKSQLQALSTKSLSPAGVIILLTGAGGVFKQMLVDTGAGEMMAQYFASQQTNMLLFSFIIAGMVRILQGSATVAMITAAGISAPMLDASISDPIKALLVLSIASGATLCSHVNDSGFWLVGQYLRLSEKQTLQTWTLMTTLLGIVGLGGVLLLGLFF